MVSEPPNTTLIFNLSMAALSYLCPSRLLKWGQQIGLPLVDILYFGQIVSNLVCIFIHNNLPALGFGFVTDFNFDAQEAK